MTPRILPFLAGAALIGLIPAANGQISLTGSSLTYTQDFDSLTRSTTAESWTDNTATVSANDAPRVIGLLGWYAGSFGTTTTTPQIRAGTGSSATGSFYSFGASGDGDRALGTLPSDSSASASMRLGVRFVNNTGSAISGFSLTYDGEEWRLGAVTAVNNQYVVAYSIFSPGAGSLDAPSLYTSIGSATFNTPLDGTGTGAALNGNDPANRVAGLTGTVTDLNVAPGDEIWIRWFDSNSSGADHGIAIDNLNVAFDVAPVPEPSALALLGLGSLLLFRRMRK